MIKKILIANRGEIACRVIRTARKLNINTVAVYSDADKDSLFVKQADESYHIGGSQPAESYLDINKIINIAKKSKADAVHPGYGFLSENAAFVKRLAKEKIKFIGPNPNAIKKMGDKIESKNLAIKLKLNVIPGHTAPVKNSKEALKISNKIGYPVLLKASAGGGGKGMRIVRKNSELEENFNAAKSESKKSFGDDRVFIEKYIEQPRHIEIQILCDKHGNQVHLGERECSIQRRYQKVIEECPSPFVDEEMRNEMASQALTLAKEVKYDSAGTVEFVVDANKNFYFLEMNTRLQVEHPVSELVTGVDLVEQMIYCADNKKLNISQKDINLKGWSVESRIYAEDPTKDFLPSIGRVTEYIEPSKIEDKDQIIRNDTGINPGSEVSLFYDPMISKLAVHSKDRATAIDLMINSLQNYYLSGVENNIEFLISILDDKKFRNGKISTNFIKEKFPKGYYSNHNLSEYKKHRIAIFAQVLFLFQLQSKTLTLNDFVIKVGEDFLNLKVTESKFEKERFYGTFKIEKKEYEIETSIKLNERLCQVSINQQIEYFKLNKLVNLNSSDISYHDCRCQTIVVSKQHETYIRLMPKIKLEDLSKKLISPMPGLIKSIDVSEGQKVKSGDQLLIIEAMKMENILKSEKDCVIDKVLIKPGDSVGADEELILFSK